MPTVWRFHRFLFEPGERRLRADGTDVAIGARALDVLEVLVERAGRLVTKSQLLDAAWPGLVVEENNVQVQVSALRRVLGNDAIVTIPGRGYRFEWPVDVVSEPVGLEPARRAFRPPPEPLFPIIGRDNDVAELRSATRAHRLTTIVGPAGIGKTRLAIEVARELGRQADAPDLLFCDLTAVTDGALVPQALAVAAGVHAVEGDVMAELLAALTGARVLLLIDNAEHVLDAVSDAVAVVLSELGQVRALVTSQTPLAQPGEYLHRVDPLLLPAVDAPAAQAARCGSVALFVACAQAADRRFTLTESNVAAVIETCRRLDGIPLALQLAAARTPHYGAAGIAARLDQRFRLLVRGSNAVPSRQRTLAAALDWSYRLLDAQQRSLLRCLSVFAGPFEPVEALAVTHCRGIGEHEVVDLIGQLVDRSLVVATVGEPIHYRLLESVRLHALEQLTATGEFDVIEQAIGFHTERAESASAASSVAAAAIGFASALELCTRLPEGPERDRRELALLLKLGPAVQASSSPGSSRCEAIYGRALALARHVDDGALLFQALWGYWHFLAMAGRDRQAAELTHELGALAEQLGDDGYQLEACHARFTTSQLLGDARATLEHAQTAIRLYVPERHHVLTYAFGGHDPGVCALGQGSVALWLVGRTAEALTMAADAERLGNGCEDAYSQAVGYYYAAMTYSTCGEIDALARAAQALEGVSERHGMAVLTVEGRLFAAHAAFARDPRSDALDPLQAAYDEIIGSGDFGFVPFYATLLADARLRNGDPVGALAVIEDALRIAEAGQGFFVPDLVRLRGDTWLAAGERQAALAAYAEARALALTQGARSLALRAAIAEARARYESGDDSGARAVLATELAGWEAATDSRDLRLARELATQP